MLIKVCLFFFSFFSGELLSALSPLMVFMLASLQNPPNAGPPQQRGGAQKPLAEACLQAASESRMIRAMTAEAELPMNCRNINMDALHIREVEWLLLLDCHASPCSSKYFMRGRRSLSLVC